MICVFLALLLFPNAGYGGKKDRKKGQDRQLVLVDETAFKKKVDELMKSDTYKELDKMQQSLIRTFVETLAQKYAEDFTFDRSEQGVQASLDSLDDLVKQRDAAEAANAGLRQECEDLETKKSILEKQLADLQASLDQKDKELARNDQFLGGELKKKDQEWAEKLAEKEKEVVRLKQEVIDAQTEGSRAIKMVNDMSAALENNLQVARESSLHELDPSFYAKLKASFDAVSPILAQLDSQKERSLRKGVDEMADLDAFRAVVADADALFSSQYEKDRRTRLLDRLKSLDKKKKVLSGKQAEEWKLYRQGLDQEGYGFHVYHFKQLMLGLKSQRSLSSPGVLDQSVTKLNAFRKEHESAPDWPLMVTLQRAVNELSAFLKLDARGQIPVALADSDQFKSKLQSIWSIVENSEL